MSRPKSHSLAPVGRIWAKVIKPLTNYERQDNGFDYCLDFFYQIEKMIELSYKIHLNIPLTLTGTHDNFLQTRFEKQEDEVGQVRVTPSFSKMKFQLQVQKSIKQSVSRIKNQQICEQFLCEDEEALNNRSILLPFVVLKQKNYQQKKYINTNIIMNSYQYKRVSTIETGQVVQSYLFTKNMKASITRFFYSSKQNKSAAYKIDNEENFIGKRKVKTLWKVDEGKQNSCSYIKIMHENKSFNFQTMHLVACIERYFQKHVMGIVTDWIIDPAGRYYLIDVKSVEMVDPKPKYRISKSLTQLLSTVTCCMCLQTCNQSQISKILTNKLIINFHEHLKSRGINLSFRINFKKISSLSRVCDLCYSLVVAESKLIEVQKKMGTICNFRTKIYDSTAPTLHDKDEQVAPQMHQWRLFFYLEDIKNFMTVFNSFEGQHCTASKMYLNLQINNSVTIFQIKCPFEDTMAIKIVKIQHLFSETLQIKQFLREAEVRVQIFGRAKASKPIAQGCVHGVYDHKQQRCDETFLQRKYKQVLLFAQNSKYCILGMYVGFCNDGLQSTQGLQLKKSLGVFKPEGNIQHCLALPAEWMEIVYHKYNENEENCEEQPNGKRERRSVADGAKLLNSLHSRENRKQANWSKKQYSDPRNQKRRRLVL